MKRLSADSLLKTSISFQILGGAQKRRGAQARGRELRRGGGGGGGGKGQNQEGGDVKRRQPISSLSTTLLPTTATTNLQSVRIPKRMNSKSRVCWKTGRCSKRSRDVGTELRTHSDFWATIGCKILFVFFHSSSSRLDETDAECTSIICSPRVKKKTKQKV